jgi:hypothetical protein
MTGDDIRGAIRATSPLNNPRLSEVPWDVVAEVLASPPAPAAPQALDLERLARVLHAIHVPGWYNGHRRDDVDLAAAIAREYAALALPVAPEKEGTE